MDNLRKAVELLFIRRDPLKIFESLTHLKSAHDGVVVDAEEFKSLFFSQWYTQYSGNQLNSIVGIINDFWSYNKILEPDINVYEQKGFKKNVFNILTHLTEPLLVSKGGVPYCKYEEYFRWTEMSRILGEDILTTNFLAAQDHNDGLVRTDYSWPAYILTDNSEMLGVFRNGLAELHNHLYASSLIFTLNWLAIMNVPELFLKQDFLKELKYYNGDYRELYLAAFIRSLLYKRIYNIEDNDIEQIFKLCKWRKDKLNCINENIAEIQHFIERRGFEEGRPPKLDYAISTRMPRIDKSVYSRQPLIGERSLLYQCFKKVNGNATKEFETLLYVYLIIKTKFRYAMLQVNSIIGFENFQHFNRNKSKFILGKYSDALRYIGLNLPVQDQFVSYIEYRVIPRMGEKALDSELKTLESNVEQTYNHGYVIHFLKGKDNGKGNCRNAQVRNKIEKQAAIIVNLILDGETRIIGIDAAGSEFNCRPEVFGKVFRQLRQSHHNQENAYYGKLKPFKLGITYHVGEDFYDIIDGLRAIDEAIKFLNLRNGDRIGHGTALGIDVLHYYDQKNYTVVMPRQILLDNIAWLIDKMERYNLPDNSGFKYVAEKMYYCFCKEIFKKDISLKTYINSWLLRGDDPDAANKLEDIFVLNTDPSATIARKDSDACKIYRLYHYDFQVRSRGSLSVEWKIDAKHRATFVNILKSIQKEMQSEVAEKHIAIECNPTSNLRIGNIPRYIDHPIIKFNNEDLIRTDGEKMPFSSQISVSINTDDAGIFATSLEKEYTLMALALEKEKDENGNPKYQRSSVYRWLENIRQNAFIRKFGADN